MGKIGSENFGYGQNICKQSDKRKRASASRAPTRLYFPIFTFESYKVYMKRVSHTPPTRVSHPAPALRSAGTSAKVEPKNVLYCVSFGSTSRISLRSCARVYTGAPPKLTTKCATTIFCTRRKHVDVQTQAWCERKEHKRP